MLAGFLNFTTAAWRYLSSREEGRDRRKRQREESDEVESGALTKRLCAMTESRMAGSSHNGTRDRKASVVSCSTSSNDLELVELDAEWPRLCYPRRPGRRLTDPPRAPLAARPAPGQVPVEREVPVLVERDMPVVVERRPVLAERRPAAPRPARSQPPPPAPPPPAAAGRGNDDVVVIAETPPKGSKAGEAVEPAGGFAGLRSFRQMVESGRVAGRASPYRRRQQQRTATKQSLYEKLIGIIPARPSHAKRGMSVLNCFRLDEKKRYQELLSGYSSVSPPSSLADVSSFRIKAAMASTPQERPAALRQDVLGPADTARLQRRISIVDLASSDSEASAAPPAAAAAAPVTLGSSSSGSEARLDSAVSDSDGSVVVEKVVPAPPRKKTQLDDEIGRQIKHFSEIREKYAASERERERQIREEEQRVALTRDGQLQWERGLSERMRRQMRLTQRVALEAEPELEDGQEEEEEVLPELTAEMESTISAALRPSPPTELLAEAFNQRITRHDLQTLKGLNWLNDEVINFYMNMIMERSKTDNSKLPKVYCFNTFFYGKIVSQGHSSVKRWTRKVDVFAYDLLLIPVHLGMHWCLACVDQRKKTVRYFDSMSGNNNKGLDAILRYLRDEHADKKKQPLDTSEWAAVNEKEIPQQMNGSDCGMFACKFAEYLARDARINFTQEDMPYFRRRMVYEIIAKTLL
ncbi:sentrin-specific protease 1-like isoform X2 [Pollicipes pollicipes]|uniref:sentrin-specific protease 1-like isoform X2 n=1 Tax=Pollicipes pollicipes TaxID=41117 RepID=UPI0018850D68|nr:sentrin-specific protease 1-like isoform X2 [Pollicipes pollicipes]